MPRAAKSPAVPVAEICLYGTRDTGAGWLVKLPAGKPFGREVKAGRTFTEAIWTAVETINDAGVRTGIVRIFEPEGLRCADVEISHHVPAFGSLTWQPAPVYEIPVAALLQAAGSAQ